MKKIISLLLIISMFAGMLTINSFAAITSEGNATSEVTFGVNQSFKLNIPSNIDFGTEKTTTATLGATQVIIEGGKALSVTLSSNNGYHLVCEPAESVPYTIGLTLGGQEVSSVESKEVLNVPSSTDRSVPAQGSQTLYLATEGTNQAGTFVDLLTFVVVIK